MNAIKYTIGHPAPGSISHFEQWLTEYRRNLHNKPMRSFRRYGALALLAYSHIGAVVFGLAMGITFAAAL